MAELQFFNLPASIGAGLDIRHAQQRSRLAELQAEMEQQKFARGTAAYEAQQKLLNSIADPQQRLAAIMAPEKFASHIFRDPKDNFQATESGVWDYSSGKPVFTPASNYGVGVAPLPGAAGGPGANLANAVPGGYAAALKGRENTTGNPAEANPRSTAVGNHQFLAGTWLDLIKTHRPALAEGRSDAEILKMRENPDLSAEMAETYAADNTPILQKAGFEPTPVNLAVMHGFGPTGGLRILEAERRNPNTPLEAVLSPEALAANPEMRGMTIAQGRAQLEQQMGQPGTGQQAPGQQAPGQMPPAPLGPQYPPNAVGFLKNNRTGEYVSGGKAGYGVLVDAAGRPVGTAPLPGQEPEGGDLFPDIPKPYASKSPDAEAENIVAQYETLRRRGVEPNMQQEYAYRLAVRRLMEQRTVQTPDGGWATVTPSPLPTSQTTAGPGGQTVTQIVEGKPKPSATEVKALKDAEVQIAQVGEAIKAYREALKKTGGPGITSVLGIPTSAVTQLNTAYNNLALLVKGDVLYQLGVLNGPDLDIIRRTLLDPSTIAAAAADPETLEGQIAQVERIIRTGIEAKRRQFGSEKAVPPTDEAPSDQAELGRYLPPPPPGAVVVP